MDFFYEIIPYELILHPQKPYYKQTDLLDPGLFLVYPVPDPVAPDPPAIVGPEMIQV